MKRVPFALCASLLLSVPALGKSPNPPAESKATVSISPGELAATPEMWFYEQYMRQYKDPQTGVRQKAEFRASERLRRLTALRWHGLSNARPVAGVDPVHGDYGPAWRSGNANHPMHWSGSTGATIVVAPSASRASR